MNMMVSALRLFFTHALDRPGLACKLVPTRYERKIPTVPSTDEVKRLLQATTSLKHQTALSVTYGAGLRAAELSKLTVSDIDSQRMLLCIERAKVAAIETPFLPKAWSSSCGNGGAPAANMAKCMSTAGSSRA